MTEIDRKDAWNLIVAIKKKQSQNKTAYLSLYRPLFRFVVISEVVECKKLKY